MTLDAAYARRRDEIQTYFDRTALDAWKRFASTEPLSRIRQTVREGRDEMRRTLLGRLPNDLSGWRILDAGCGAGAASFELAARGASVVAIDLSPQIVAFAAERAETLDLKGDIEFHSGDMLDPALGAFDGAIAMDSLIHYSPDAAVDAVTRLSERVSEAMVFTVAPKTPLLAAMHTVGKAFPRSDRAPMIVPMPIKRLARRIADEAVRPVSDVGRVSRGFYISHALEVGRT